MKKLLILILSIICLSVSLVAEVTRGDLKKAYDAVDKQELINAYKKMSSKELEDSLILELDTLQNLFPLKIDSLSRMIDVKLKNSNMIYFIEADVTLKEEMKATLNKIQTQTICKDPALNYIINERHINVSYIYTGLNDSKIIVNIKKCE